jgi:hypothetical protein
MAYTKTNWLDRIVEFANRYTKSGETSTEVTLIQSPGTVTQTGTLNSAALFNKMEQGIADVHDAADAHIVATTGIHGATTAASANRIVQRDGNGDITGRRFISGVADGTAPMSVTSRTVVPNLGSDTVDGIHFRTINGYVEYDDGSGWKPVGGIKSVQRGVVTSPGNTGTINVPISAVNMAKAYINFPNIYTGDGTAIRAVLSSSTNLQITRQYSQTTPLDLSWEVIESY